MNFTIPKILTRADIISTNLNPSTETEYSGACNAGDIRKVSYASDGITPVLPVKTFKALVNTNSYPPENADPDDPNREWEDLGAVNQDRMFDQKTDTGAYADGTESVDPGKIVFELDAGRQNKVALFNVEATKVTFELVDSSDVVMDTTVYDLATEVEDLEEYFFKDFDDNFDVIHAFDSLLVSTLRITIEHEDVGLFPGCGFCVIGINQYAGEEFNTPNAGFRGFETAEDFKTGGQPLNYPSEEMIDLDVRLPTADISKVHRATAAIRGRATLVEGIKNKYDPFTSLAVLANYEVLYRGDRKCELSYRFEGIK